MECVLVSSNPQKVLQIKAIFKELMPRATLRSLFDFPNYTPIEKGETIAERALHKAQDAAKTLGVACLSEQWQLEVCAIDLKPVFQEQNRALQIRMILQKLENQNEMQRSCFLQSAICFAKPDGKTHQVQARVEGTISQTERGKGGLDFESIFIKYDYVKTLAELGDSVKSRISHRRKALEKLMIYVSD